MERTKKEVTPKVGVGVIVINNGKILLGERVYSHGKGTWCPPGGHLEFGERPENCALRELKEETGIIATKVVVGPWTNDYFESEEKHYITIYMFITEFEGSPIVMEPEKCASWEWFSPENLPSPLFLSLENLLKNNPFEKLVEVYHLNQ